MNSREAIYAVVDMKPIRVRYYNTVGDLLEVVGYSRGTTDSMLRFVYFDDDGEPHLVVVNHALIQRVDIIRWDTVYESPKPAWEADQPPAT